MLRKNRIASALLAAASATSLLIAGDGVAGAGEPVGDRTPDEADVTSDVFGVPLDQFLASYPNAEPLADGAYQLEPGVRLVPPRSPSDADGDVGVMEDPSGCPDNWVCIFQHSDFEGWGMQLYYCTPTNLQVPYRNNVSSMHNAQNGATMIVVDTGPSPDVAGSLGPNRYLRNLARNGAPDGGSWNDRIDVVDPC